MDCREEFLAATENALRLGMGRSEFTILRPLIGMGKDDIIKVGLGIGAPLRLTWSCYKGGDVPCGKCDSCILRANGFATAGVQDPAIASGITLSQIKAIAYEPGAEVTREE
jgi:7-cyano-7-deazaguanine synthase